MGLHQSCGRLIIDTGGHTVTLIGARQSSIIYLSLGGSLTVALPGLNINNKQTTTDHHPPSVRGPITIPIFSLHPSEIL